MQARTFISQVVFFAIAMVVSVVITVGVIRHRADEPVPTITHTVPSRTMVIHLVGIGETAESSKKFALNLFHEVGLRWVEGTYKEETVKVDNHWKTTITAEFITAE
jgi:hypothetical protein